MMTKQFNKASKKITTAIASLRYDEFRWLTHPNKLINKYDKKLSHRARRRVDKEIIKVHNESFI